MSKKPTFVSTELFKGKSVPDLFTKHELFINPVKVSKVFGSIGLPNFSDKVKIEKPLTNIRKEGSFVYNLFKTSTELLVSAKDTALILADGLQYLESQEVRDASKDRIISLYEFSNLLSNIASMIDPYSAPVFDTMVSNSQGKLVLSMPQDIQTKDGKTIFKKGEGFFRVMNKLKERCEELGVRTVSLDTTVAFAVFGKENIPNKGYSVVFSADGPDGAWDIITMSMRGIRSCQRWDGEYPTCLVGSVLSKYVGIIYLTSGVEADDNIGFKKLGTKMMRRCIVRYAIDADESAPCILIDKMYPDPDKEILDAFLNSLRSRVKIPVYYSPELGTKLKHIYLPNEEIRDGLSDRYWSYQDSPVKSARDLQAFVLNYTNEELDRDVKGFKINLSLFMAKMMESIYSGDVEALPEIRKTINNIRMNASFSLVCDNLTAFLMPTRVTPKAGCKTSKEYYRKYLMSFLSNRKILVLANKGNLNNLVKSVSSRTVDTEAFSKFITSLMAKFVISEIKKLPL